MIQTGFCEKVKDDELQIGTGIGEGYLPRSGKDSKDQISRSNTACLAAERSAPAGSPLQMGSQRNDKMASRRDEIG